MQYVTSFSLPSVSGEGGSQKLVQDLRPNTGREVSQVSIRWSQTAKPEVEAKSPESRQVRSRLCNMLPWPDIGEAGVRTVAQLRAALWGQLVFSLTQYQCMNTWDGGSPVEATVWMAAVSSTDPALACAFLPRAEQPWVKEQLEGSGCSWLPSHVHSQGDATTYRPHREGGRSQDLSIFSGAAHSQQRLGMSISCPYKERGSNQTLHLSRNSNYPEAQMKQTYPGTALEE